MKNAIVIVLVILVVTGALVLILSSKQKSVQPQSIADVATRLANEISKESSNAAQKYNQYLSSPEPTSPKSIEGQQDSTGFTALWKTFVSKEYGFSVKYPSGSNIIDNASFLEPVSFMYPMPPKSYVQALIGRNPSYCSEAFLPDVTKTTIGNYQFYKFPDMSALGVTKYFLVTKDKAGCYSLEFRYSGDKKTANEYINGYMLSFKLI